MGLNIFVVKMPGWKIDNRFDFLRHTGDGAFATAPEIEWTHHDEDSDLRRPVDMEAARSWVRGNVQPEANVWRLIEGLDLLASDAGLWMSFDW